jgi:hypothetical protein
VHARLARENILIERLYFFPAVHVCRKYFSKLGRNWCLVFLPETAGIAALLPVGMVLANFILIATYCFDYWPGSSKKYVLHTMFAHNVYQG